MKSIRNILTNNSLGNVCKNIGSGFHRMNLTYMIENRFFSLYKHTWVHISIIVYKHLYR